MGDEKKDPAAIENQKEQLEADKKTVTKLRAFKKYARDHRVRMEVLWYELQLLKDGDHWKLVKRTADVANGNVRVLPVTKKTGEIRRTINKFRSLLRSIKAFTTLTKTRWDVPGNSDEAKTAANYLNWFIEFDERFPKTIRNVIEYGFLRSVGYFDVYWDNDKKIPVVAARDPFDLLMDPAGRFMVRTYRKPLKDLKEEKDAAGELAFKNIPDNLKATSKMSSSEIFQNYLNAKYQSTVVGNPDVDEVMLEEYHVLERNDEGNMVTRIITVPEDSDQIIREETVDDDEFRFVPYWAEERPNDIYSEPWMKDAVDPQRAINNTFSHMEEWMRTINKGRLIKHKDTKIDRISDKDGQVVEYDGPDTRKPEFVQPPTMTNDPMAFFNLSERVMEDSVGVHPSEIRKTETAKGIGYLIANDETNISEPFENLKTSLVQVARRILKLSVKHMQSSKEIFWWEGEDFKEGSVISETADNKPDAAKLLKFFDTVRVELVPTGAFMSMIRRNDLMELYKAGVLKDPQTILEGGAYGNVKEIVEREKKFRAQEQVMGGKPGEPVVDEESAPREELESTAKELSTMMAGQAGQ